MSQPIVHDLCCGLFGWGAAFIQEGYRVVGYDIVDMHAELGLPRPTEVELVIQDILTLHGSRCKDAAVIVASPPCQKYSYMAMPWKKAKTLAAWYRESPERIEELNALFNACFRIQREASEAAGRHIPLIVENVRGAQPWVGRSAWNFGSYHLWGDVPALMPIPYRVQKFNPDGTGHPPGSWFAIADSKNRGSGSWFKVAHNTASGVGHNPDGRKVPGQDWSTYAKTGKVSPHWRMELLKQRGESVKGNGSWFGNYREAKAAGRGSANRYTSSNSLARARASAEIAKIPFPLAQHIAKTFRQAA